VTEPTKVVTLTAERKVTVGPVFAAYALTDAVQQHGAPVDTQPFGLAVAWGWSTTRCVETCERYGIFRLAPCATYYEQVGEIRAPETVWTATIAGDFCYRLGGCLDAKIPALAVMASGFGSCYCSSTVINVPIPCEPVMGVGLGSATYCVEGVGWKVDLHWRLVENPLCPTPYTVDGYKLERSALLQDGGSGSWVVVSEQPPWLPTCPVWEMPGPVLVHEPCYTDQPPGPGDWLYQVTADLTANGKTETFTAQQQVTVGTMLSSYALTGAVQQHGVPVDAQPFELAVAWEWSTMRCSETCERYGVFRLAPCATYYEQVGEINAPDTMWTATISGYFCYRLGKCLGGGTPALAVTAAGFGSCYCSSTQTIPSCDPVIGIGLGSATYCVDGVGWKADLHWKLSENPLCPTRFTVDAYTLERAAVLPGGGLGLWAVVSQQPPWLPGCQVWVPGKGLEVFSCYTDQPPGPGNWMYQVTADLTAGEKTEAFTAQRQVTVGMTFDSPFLDTREQTGPFKVSLSWGSKTSQCSMPCTSYYVFHTTGGAPSLAGYVEASSPSFTDPNPLPGPFNCYLLACAVGGGAMTVTPYECRPVTPIPQCWPPDILAGGDATCVSNPSPHGEVDVRWKVVCPDLINAFSVYRSEVSGGMGTLVSGPAPYVGEEFVDSDPSLVPGQTYYYRVCSFPPVVCSQEISVTVPLMFTGKVLAGVSTPAPGTLLLDWKMVGPYCWTPCTTYIIYRNTGAGPYPIANADENTNVFVDTIPAGTGQLCYSLLCSNGGSGLLPIALTCSTCLSGDPSAFCTDAGGPGRTRSLPMVGPSNDLFSTVFTTSAPVAGGVAACGGLEVFGTTDGTVYVIYPDGIVKCTTKVTGAIEFSPVYDRCNGRAWIGTAAGLVYPISVDTCDPAGPTCGGVPRASYDVGGRVAGPLALDCNGNPLVSVETSPGIRCLIKLDAQGCSAAPLSQQCFPVTPGAPAPAPLPLPLCGASACPTCVGSCSLFSESCLECQLQDWAEIPGGGILRVENCGGLTKLCCGCKGGRVWCCYFKGEVFQPVTAAYVPGRGWFAYVAVNEPEGPAVFSLDLENGGCNRVCDLSAPVTGAPVASLNRIYTPTKNGIESCCLDGSCTTSDIIATCPNGDTPANLHIVYVNTPGFVTTQLIFTCGGSVMMINTQPGPPVVSSVVSGSGGNQVSWSPGTKSSSGLAVVCYNVYRAVQVDGSAKTQIAACVTGNAFIDPDPPLGVAVCYYVQAVDSEGNTSPLSDAACTMPVLAGLDLEAPPSVQAGALFSATITVMSVGGTAGAGAAGVAILEGASPAAGAALVTDTAFVGTVLLVSDDPLAVLPAEVQFGPDDHGVRRLLVQLNTKGLITLTASVKLRPEIRDSAVVDVLGPSGKTERLALSATPLTISGIAFSLTVTAMDKSGGVETGFRGTVAFTSTDPLATLPASSSFTKAHAGRRVFNVVLRSLGLQQIVATDVSIPHGAEGLANVQVFSPLPPTPPLNLSALAPGDNAIHLTWSPTGGEVAVSGYSIFRSTSPDWFLQVDSVFGGWASTFLDAALPEFTTYFYVIRAVDVFGSISSTSNMASATLSPPIDWPIASYWMSHRGYSPTASPAAPFEVKWRIAGGFYSSTYGTGGSVVAGSRVYQIFGHSLLGADLEGQVVARAGFPYGIPEGVGTQFCSPAVIGDTVVIGFDLLSVSGNQYSSAASPLYAYDAATLALRWISQIADGYLATFGGFSNLVAGGHLVFGGNPYGLAAVDMRTGLLVWSEPNALYYAFTGATIIDGRLVLPASRGIGGPVVGSDMTVYAAFPGGALRAVNGLTGAGEWTKTIGTDPRGAPFQPVLKNGVLFVGSGRALMLFDAGVGAALGQVSPDLPEAGAAILAVPPVIDDQNHAYFFSGGAEGSGIPDRLHAFDVGPVFSGGTAVPLWERSDVTANVLSVAGNLLTAFMSDDAVSEGLGGLLLLDTGTGQTVQLMEGVPTTFGTTTAPGWSSPLVADKLFLSSVDLSMAAPGPGVNPPYGLTALGSAGEIDLGWQVSEKGSFDVVRYHIFRSTGPSGFTAGRRIAIVTTTFYADTPDTGLPSAVPVFYVVRAGDSVGNLSPPSSVASAMDPLIDLIVNPRNGATIVEDVDVVGSAGGPDCAEWVLEVLPQRSGGKDLVLAVSTTPMLDGVLSRWKVEGVTPGMHVLRLTVKGKSGGFKAAVCAVHVVPKRHLLVLIPEVASARAPGSTEPKRQSPPRAPPVAAGPAVDLWQREPDEDELVPRQ